MILSNIAKKLLNDTRIISTSCPTISCQSELTRQFIWILTLSIVWSNSKWGRSSYNETKDIFPSIFTLQIQFTSFLSSIFFFTPSRRKVDINFGLTHFSGLHNNFTKYITNAYKKLAENKFLRKKIRFFISFVSVKLQLSFSHKTVITIRKQTTGRQWKPFGRFHYFT